MADVSILTYEGTEVSLGQAELGSLRQAIKGELLLSSDSRYDQARKIWNGLIDKRPALILACAGSEDVVVGVRFAERHRLLLSVRGGGHNVAGSSLCDGGMVIDLSGMRGVHVDRQNATVRADGGVMLGGLDRATQAHGLAVPVGLVSATGVAGLTLHGGLGWLARRHGMTIDNLRSARVVTADGQVRTAAPGKDEELLWALKGGGGSFGVVTSFEFQAHPVGPHVWLSMPMYPAAKATEALSFYREFMASAPDELTGLAIFWQAPSQPPIPERAWGAEVIILAACYSGPAEHGEQAIRPLREFDDPLADLSSAIPFLELQQFLDADYPDGDLYYWKSVYLGELRDEVIAVLARQAAKRPSARSSIDVWGLGGAVSRVPASATPFARREAQFLIGIESNWDEPEESEANIAWARETYTAMQPFSLGSYLNFPGLGEEGEQLLRGAYGGNFERLQAAKKRYDPQNLFRGTLSVRSS
jgi:FAD/FMN-containing dehydrogenase